MPPDRDTAQLAAQYVLRARVRTPDALHLAACARFGEATSDEVRLLSRDTRQNDAARAVGITLLEF